jgi:para-nitrobenzyl esterase
MASTTLRVAEGRLEGARSADGLVRSFKGIPYAQPPVGPLRWREPLPPRPWDGTRDARAFGPTAPQLPLVPTSLYAGGHEHQSEDCLTLNVWTPAQSPDDRLPVMVWLHFGAFQFGGASVALYDGERLAGAGAVVVTLNHRLGRLGFLAHPWLAAESAHDASGNYGIHDQIRALEWLAENVERFGGDPGAVTVFGLSAGSQSICMLMASPLARGLFHRAIGMSGATLGPPARSTGVTDSLQRRDAAEATGAALARALDARTLEELRARSPQELLLAELDPPGEDRWRFDAVDAPFWRGALDGAFPSIDGRLLPEPAYAIFAAGRQASVPLITGSAAGEGSGMPYMPDAARFAEDARSQYGPRAAEFLALYPAADDEQAARSSAAANGDRVFVWQNWAWANLHAAAGAPTFYYHFSREPPIPAGAAIAERHRGAFHGAEIPYVFRNLGVRTWAWTDADRELAEVISGHWLHFARTGEPGGGWAPFDGEAAMHFGERCGPAPVPRRAHLAFWDDHYERCRAAAAREEEDDG